MKITSYQVKGKGRGKVIGFPTINLKIPSDFLLEDGIYAVWVTIGGKRYKGALHFGPIPTYEEEKKSLEVFLLDTTEDALIDVRNEEIILDTVKKIRDIMKFNSTQELTKQIGEDILLIETILM
ncbi:riboflavin kinase [Candidatus Gottesmanbacteria bacterium]|nr:riboflavin kinase [Candidatus Gottesmanbacteria bacterium]